MFLVIVILHCSLLYDGEPYLLSKATDASLQRETQEEMWRSVGEEDETRGAGCYRDQLHCLTLHSAAAWLQVSHTTLTLLSCRTGGRCTSLCCVGLHW